MAGAGPAGTQCARDLAALDYDVPVLETESEVESPRQRDESTGGTFLSMLSSFNVPDDVVMQVTDRVVLVASKEFDVREHPGRVLEFAGLSRAWWCVRGAWRFLVVDCDGSRRAVDRAVASRSSMLTVAIPPRDRF